MKGSLRIAFFVLPLMHEFFFPVTLEISFCSGEDFLNAKVIFDTAEF